jgi:protein SCO1/2
MNYLRTVILFTFLAVSACAGDPQPITRLTFDQNVNEQVTLNLPFRDEHNGVVLLKECIRGGPCILVLGYYECPMLCNLVLNGVVESLQEIKAAADTSARLIFVSIDPREKPDLALSKKRTYSKRYGRGGTDERWHFLCGAQDSVAELTREVGFHYAYDDTHKQFAHPSGIVILTPQGRISRYFFGVSYPSDELRIALARAASEKPASPVQSLLILCSRFVPLTGKFSGTVMLAVRAVAIVTVLLLIGIAFFARSPKEGGNA